MNAKQGVVVNADSDFLWYVYGSNQGDVTDFENVLKAYVQGYANNGISDLLLCCFCQMSLFPSKVMPWYGDKFYMREENGIPVDYTRHERIKHVVEIYDAMPRDPFEVVIEETRKCGMRAWLSIRMNDCHCPFEETVFLRSNDYYEAQKNGWMIGNAVAGDYYSRCLNYGVKEVREKMFAYVCETLDRYDVDGLELDFQRELFCFDYLNNPDCHQIATEFMQRVRAYAREKEKERKHAIKIGVRLCRDIEDNKRFGFDVVTWVRQGLIDVVVPTSRWENTDSDMPISKWKRLVENTGVSLWAGLETHLFCPYANDLQTIKGFAAQYLDAGADAIYLFNYFRTRAKREERTQEELQNAGIELYSPNFSSHQRDEALSAIWRACSNVENAKAGVRIHVVTFREDCMTPIGATAYHPFPMDISGEKRVFVQTGDCVSDNCTLRIGVAKGGKIFGVTVDGEPAVPLGETNAHVKNLILDGLPSWKTTTLNEATYYAFAFKGKAGNTRRISIFAECRAEYLEIEIKKAK